MNQNIFFLIFLSLFVHFAHAQPLVISVDGKNNPSTDTFFLHNPGPAFARMKGPSKGQNIPLPVYPGKVNTYSVTVCQPDLYFIGSGGRVLLAQNDSINVLFNAQLGTYNINGGKYPGNYTIYNAFESVSDDFGRYKTKEDNYKAYAKYLDSFSLARQTVLDAEKAKGGISGDVYEYMRAYIKYGHLVALLATNSVTLSKMLPQTGSVFAPKVSASDFGNDMYLSMPKYQVCIELYIEALLKRQGTGKITIGFHSPASKVLYAKILFSIDSLKGETRQEAVFGRIMNTDWRDMADDKYSFQPLFERLKQLKLPQNDLKLMAEQYSKALLNGDIFDTALSANTYLVSLDNKRQSLQSVLQGCKGKKVIIDLWWTADEENVLSADAERNNSYPSNDYTIIHIAVNRRPTPDRWMKMCKSSGLTGAQYYLEDHFNSPLLSYFHVSKLPQYISIDQTGKIENSDLPFYFMTPVDSVKDSAAR